LYPKLEDNDVVKCYPHIMGMQKDVFFLTHTHPENGEVDSVSKYNVFEVCKLYILLSIGPSDTV
jgi:hypothetical protein